MVPGKLPVPGRPTVWMIVGQMSIALAVGAGGVVWTFFTLYLFSPLSPSLWETARYRLKYCWKGPLNPKQPTDLISLLQIRRSIEDNSKIIFIFLNKNMRCDPSLEPSCRDGSNEGS